MTVNLLDNDRLVSRSPMETQQICPRLRYWQYEHKGKGIVPKFANIPMNTGSAVHKGMEFCFKVWMVKGEKAILANLDKVTDIAVHRAITWYCEFVAESGGLAGEGMSPANAKSNDIERVKQEVTYNEQMGLIAGLVTVWCLVELPMLIKYFDIESTERECTVYIGEQQYRLLNQARADGILRSKKGGDLYIYQLKTCKEFNWSLELSYSTDMQSITDLYTIRKSLVPEDSHRLLGIKFCYLVKGKKYKDPELGIWRVNSPLLNGWRQFTPSGIGYAHTNKIPKPENKSGFGYLGKGWEEFSVLDSYTGTHQMTHEKIDGWRKVVQWVRDIYNGKVQADMYDPITWLKGLCVTPLEVSRDQREIDSVMAQLLYQESRVKQALQLANILDVNDSEALALNLDMKFPQHFRSCWYPSDCYMLPVCHGKKQWERQPVLVTIEDMMELTGAAEQLYTWRTPHHEMERVRNADKE